MASSANQEEEFLQRLRATFKVEAEEHLHVISSQLLELESIDGGGKSDQLETIFRHVHSLKGAARAVSIPPVERICQVLESLFVKWKAGEITPPSEAYDLLHKATDIISESVPDSSGIYSNPDEARLGELLAALEKLLSPQQNNPAEPGGQPVMEVEDTTAAKSGETSGYELDEVQPQMTDATYGSPDRAALPVNEATVRVPTAKLDQLLLQAEEMLAVKITSAARSAEVKGMKAAFSQWEKEWTAAYMAMKALAGAKTNSLSEQANGRSVGGEASSITTSLSHSSIISDDVSHFLEWNAGFVRAIAEKLNHLAKGLGRDQHSAARLVDDLLSDSKKLLMLPFSTLGDMFPKLVRDLSREQGKQVNLVLEGREMEMDKRILEEMKDPLIHLVRNCIDHGIEQPEVRRSQQKNPRGEVTIRATQIDGNTVGITVADDGAGIDLEKVKASAVKRRLILPQEADSLSDQDALMLIFKSQFSTKPMITEISGRGLGLAIVQETVHRLGGRISVESSLQAGTTFLISLPSSFATLSGLLVRVGRQVYVLPAANVVRVVRIDPADVKMVQDRETISIDSMVLPFVYLGSILTLNSERYSPEERGQVPIVITVSGDDRIAFGVEEVLNVQDVPVRTLKKPLLRVNNIMGATTLESGRVIPILNANDLVKSAQNGRPASAGTIETQPLASEIAPKKILVAEDSITSRMLLKGILESAGYLVHTAVDGVEAITTLRTDDFDLVVSDIEMPRMNGFDLTAQIRRDRKLAEKPVVLVTALSSQEDRERGIDVGADAYIVKSSFDQSDLLDVIRRLI